MIVNDTASGCFDLARQAQQDRDATVVATMPLVLGSKVCKGRRMHLQLASYTRKVGEFFQFRPKGESLIGAGTW